MIKLHSILEKGNLDGERLIIEVIEETDIGNFTVFQTGYNTNSNLPTINVRHVFWFPNKRVNVGDYIILYTRAGDEKEMVMKGGENTAYFYYWNFDHAIWENENRCAVLLHSPNWEVLSYPFEKENT